MINQWCSLHSYPPDLILTCAEAYKHTSEVVSRRRENLIMPCDRPKVCLEGKGPVSPKEVKKIRGHNGCDGNAPENG